MNKDSGSASRVESEPQRETLLALLNALDD